MKLIQSKDKLKENFILWKKKSLNDSGYFIIFNGFLEADILSKISGGALKLYVFLGIKSNNNTGESFYKIGTMARYFLVSERTISTWIRELEELGLIVRKQDQFNSVSHTYLKPYYAGLKGKSAGISANGIELDISNYLYHEQHLDPAEFVEDYSSKENISPIEMIAHKFPKTSKSERKLGWSLFYNMPPQEKDN